MKKIMNPTTITALLAAVVIIQSLFITTAFNKIHKLESAKTSVAPSQDQQNQFAVSLAALNAVGLSQPVVSVSDNKVYLPDILLALPLNDTTLSLLYAGRTTGSPDKQIITYDITTRALASLSPIGFQQELACYPVRLAFEEKANPFNPHEKNNSAVKLTDGRTLRIYTDSDSKCSAQWNASRVVPDKIKEAFEQATAY